VGDYKIGNLGGKYIKILVGNCVVILLVNTYHNLGKQQPPLAPVGAQEQHLSLFS